MNTTASSFPYLRGTTVLAVKDTTGVAMAGDGQVTLGQSIAIKHTARKVRRLYKDRVLAGFAGATADAFTLFERFEAKLEEFSGQIVRASVELAKDWRKDKYLRRLEAMLLVADASSILLLSGTGDVIEPDDGIAAIGSGAPYALAAARALSRHAHLPCDKTALEAMRIAAELCVFTNDSIVLETLSVLPPSK
ncbi:MAG: ATP-dependent protease subunit HslV [Desulfovibrio sp.]|nr:ATP-dependent protease subunit HslV [Desulfovibrio sp.]